MWAQPSVPMNWVWISFHKVIIMAPYLVQPVFLRIRFFIPTPHTPLSAVNCFAIKSFHMMAASLGQGNRKTFHFPQMHGSLFLSLVKSPKTICSCKHGSCFFWQHTTLPFADNVPSRLHDDKYWNKFLPTMRREHMEESKRNFFWTAWQSSSRCWTEMIIKQGQIWQISQWIPRLSISFLYSFKNSLLTSL